MSGDDFLGAEALNLAAAFKAKASADGEWRVDTCKLSPTM